MSVFLHEVSLGRGAALRFIGVGFVGLAVACTNAPPSEESVDGDETAVRVDLPRPGDRVQKTIGPEGGVIELRSAKLTVPEGALEEAAEISVSALTDEAPNAFIAEALLLEFEPDGLQFLKPATLSLPFEGQAASEFEQSERIPTGLSTIFWTADSEKEFYTPLKTQLDGQIATAEITHFSRGFVGKSCFGEECCSPANGDVDVLLVVDSSKSMAEEQNLLKNELPKLARTLTTGDLDEDGAQDIPAAASVRLGVVSADMGAYHGPPGTPGCRNGIGDDGVLRTSSGESSPAPECGTADAPTDFGLYAPIEAGANDAAQSEFLQHVSCTASVGIEGCGFEQPLESALKALAPSTEMSFTEGTGHGDGENAGFLRDDAILAVIVVSDEDDCSASDRELYNVGSQTYTEDLNMRCGTYLDAQHEVTRYVDGLRALKGNPENVVFAAIAGVPADLVPSGDTPADYRAILDDPRMEFKPEETDSVVPTGLPASSCETADGGSAYPPRRLVQTAEQFEGAGMIQSICAPTFEPAVRAILGRVGKRIRGECL